VEQVENRVSGMEDKIEKWSVKTIKKCEENMNETPSKDKFMNHGYKKDKRYKLKLEITYSMT
jgi:hypothetical protein